MGIMEGILAGGQGLASGINALGAKIEDQIAKEQFRQLLLNGGLIAPQTSAIPTPQDGAMTLGQLGRAPQNVSPPIPGIGGAGGAVPSMAGGAEKFGQGFANEFQNKWAGKPASVPTMAYAPAPNTAPQSGGPVPQSLIASESGGNWGARNNVARRDGTTGHFGRLQFSQPRLAEAVNAGVLPAGITPQQFMASPELQRATEAWHLADIDKFIQQQGLDRAIGSTINGVPVTLDGMRAVAHLGGKDGLAKFIGTGGGYNPADANGTTLMSYLAMPVGRGQTNPLARIPPMDAGGSSPAPAAPMTLANFASSSTPQAQPQFNLAMLADLATNKYGAPIAAAILQKQLGRDPVQAQLAMAQLEGAKLANEAKRREIAGEGAKLSYQDLGNDIAVLNAKGEIVRTIPKSRAPVALGEGQRLVDPNSGNTIAGQGNTVADREAQKEIGQAQGKQATAAPQAIMSGQLALRGIDEIIKHPAFNDSLFGGLGKQGVVWSRIPGSEAYAFKQRVDQLRGQTFLQAYEGLRGGGAITDVEGKKAEMAIARLDTAQSPAEFRAALEDLRGILHSGMKRAAQMGQRFGTVPSTPAAPQPQQYQEGQTASNPQTGQRIRFTNGQWVPVQ